MSTQQRIDYQPTQGLSYDPSEARYFDAAALDLEVRRVFDICASCRLCFKYCDSFPTLFKLLDERHDGDVHKLAEPEVKAVVDACFQCKLCEVQCPYTPRDKHAFQLDFPKLMHRYQAVRVRRHGVGWRDSMLGDPDLAGQAARLSFGMANRMNRVGLHRWFLEKVLGVHREKLLPDFAATTFERWADDQRLIDDEPGAETVLFPTCYVQNNEPQIGRDTVEVLHQNQVEVRCLRGLECCGMPAWEHGDLATLRSHARANLDRLVPHAEAGSKVVVINPTCSMMLRREYPELVAPEDKPRARILADAVRDPSEYLWSIRDQPRFNTDFKSTPGERVAYHAPCHLRTQAIGFRGRDLLRLIPGVVPEMVSECCGHDGTYAMKVEGFETSKRVGANAFKDMQGVQAEVWATDCPLAALQFAQHAGVKPMHPMSILARAYRPDGFPKPVQPAPDRS